MKHGVTAEQVVLEYPHPAIQGARIDTIIVDASNHPNTAIEFKYDRANPGGTNQPMPQKAGAAFADLKRLSLVPLFAERIFVYVTDRELARYLSSPRNGLHEVFELGVGQSLELSVDYFVGRSATFHGRLGEWPGEIRLENLLSRELPNDHFLWIYAVDQIANVTDATTATPLHDNQMGHNV
jgi:hypothetical protein